VAEGDARVDVLRSRFDSPSFNTKGRLMPETPATPSQYIAEGASLPPQVVEVPTSIAAFVGYTERAQRDKPDDLRSVPTTVSSLSEFEKLFGGPMIVPLSVTVTSAPLTTALDVRLIPPARPYQLHYALQLFFANGGGVCVIVSVGGYAEPMSVARDELLGALTVLDGASDAALLLIPDATLLAPNDYAVLVQATLAHCAQQENRFAILDLHDGATPQTRDTLPGLRDLFGTDNLRFGAVYYPFLRTSIAYPGSAVGTNVRVAIDGRAPVTLRSLLKRQRPVFQAVQRVLADATMVVPPGGAVAGVYVSVDTMRGVWKAPANVALQRVLAPAVQLNDVTAEFFNVDDTGKSIALIRAFTGKGTLMWGARTLLGNDNEWRYVPTQRFVRMITTSIAHSTQWTAFEPNDATTWTRIVAQIENYLMLKWRDGALQGATSSGAFFVQCGLGSTMTALDVQEGRVIVQFGVATTRPAEFIVSRVVQRTAVS
jgi:uncharacterized protein